MQSQKNFINTHESQNEKRSSIPKVLLSPKVWTRMKCNPLLAELVNMASQEKKIKNKTLLLNLTEFINIPNALYLNSPSAFSSKGNILAY